MHMHFIQAGHKLIERVTSSNFVPLARMFSMNIEHIKSVIHNARDDEQISCVIFFGVFTTHEISRRKFGRVKGA